MQNNFSQQPLNEVKDNRFMTRNKLPLTLALIAVSLFLLGIQLMPYIYGGSLSHFHSGGICEWPNDCSKVNSLSPF